MEPRLDKSSEDSDSGSSTDDSSLVTDFTNCESQERFGISAPRTQRLISVEPDEDSTNPPPDALPPYAPAALQPRSRAELTLAQVSPVFVRVCATGRRPGSFHIKSSPRSSNSPAPHHSILPQGTNPIQFQSQTVPISVTTITPSPHLSLMQNQSNLHLRLIGSP
jgi:hypothetical protein